ncbi:MAG: ATP-binding cassette domain-containing protein [Bacteroidales bacterium]|nr:ATP-binding cassette domain-containing protein [Bacteroidales bacterium]
MANNNEYIFKIKNLRCTYNGDNEVLRIDELNIRRGKIIVLLGISGSGKSTFLETLGLMNNTLSNGSKVYFYPKDDGIDIGEIWEKKDHKTLAKLRQEHFSFIFQNTNLMPNFTAFENISLTQMIEGCSKEVSIINAKRIAEDLGLQIDEKKKTHELSGGEKQRAAFVRAIAPEFTVLFGDEPTGNLDEINAELLMDTLEKKIREKQRTAIIVSHDIKLAIKYADQIIIIKKVIINEEQSYGEICNDNIYNASIKNKTKIWNDSHGKPVVEDINSIIKKHFINNKN